MAFASVIDCRGVFWSSGGFEDVLRGSNPGLLIALTLMPLIKLFLPSKPHSLHLKNSSLNQKYVSINIQTIFQ